MATGEVQFNNAQIGSTAYAGYPVSNAFDNDFGTNFDNATASGGYIGLDLGVAAELTEFQFATAPRDGSANRAARTSALILQGSNTSATAGLTTLAPLSSASIVTGYQCVPLPVPLGGTTYRFYVVTDPGANYCEIGEMRFIGRAGTAAPAQPVAPKIGPWGGRFPSGAATVTLTSRTTSASLYYTLDGTTPTTASAHYTGPFAINCAAGDVTLNVLAHDASLSTPDSAVSTATFTKAAFVPRADWRDDNGELIEIHVGSVLDDTARSGRFYAYGTNFNCDQIPGVPEADKSYGVWCYSTADLCNWRCEGKVLANPAGFNFTINEKVIYCAATGKYVLWSQSYNYPSGEANRATIATANSPAGPWTWTGAALAAPNGNGLRDFDVFVDADSTAYATYAAGTSIYVSKLTADYQNFSSAGGDTSLPLFGSAAESPALFKRGSTYFLLYSAVANYFNSANTFQPSYATATNLLGPWTAHGTSFAGGDPTGTNFNGQTRFVLKVPGKADGYIFGSDYYTQPLYGSRAVWLPITFPTANTLQVQTPASWDLSLFADSVTPPGITSPATASGTVGAVFSYPITASNSPTSFGAAVLPAGLSVNTATGLISGTPTAAGTNTITLSATNAGGTGTATLTLTVAAATVLTPAPVITSPLAVPVTVGAGFSYQIAASNAPTAWSATGLPTGLALLPGTPWIVGALATAGTYSVTIGASNAGGTASQALVLTAAASTIQGQTNPALCTGHLRCFDGDGLPEGDVEFTFEIISVRGSAQSYARNFTASTDDDGLLQVAQVQGARYRISRQGGVPVSYTVPTGQPSFGLPVVIGGGPGR